MRWHARARAYARTHAHSVQRPLPLCFRSALTGFQGRGVHQASPHPPLPHTHTGTAHATKYLTCRAHTPCMGAHTVHRTAGVNVGQRVSTVAISCRSRARSVSRAAAPHGPRFKLCTPSGSASHAHSRSMRGSVPCAIGPCAGNSLYDHCCVRPARAKLAGPAFFGRSAAVAGDGEREVRPSPDCQHRRRHRLRHAVPVPLSFPATPLPIPRSALPAHPIPHLPIPPIPLSAKRCQRCPLSSPHMQRSMPQALWPRPRDIAHRSAVAHRAQRRPAPAPARACTRRLMRARTPACACTHDRPRA